MPIDEGEVDVSSVLQSFGNTLGDVIRTVGQRLPDALFGRRPVQTEMGVAPYVGAASLLNPATWGMWHYLLIGGAVYFLLRPKRR